MMMKSMYYFLIAGVLIFLSLPVSYDRGQNTSP